MLVVTLIFIVGSVIISWIYASSISRPLNSIRDFKRSTILLDNVHHVDVINVQGSIFYSKLILREIESLADQVDVFVLHP